MADSLSRLLTFFLLFGILYTVSVGAVGISSYDSVVKEVDFQAGKEIRFQYFITQTTGRVMDYSFSKSGHLSQYLRFDPPLFSSATPGQTLPFEVILNFPEDDENITAGQHTIFFGVQEQTPPSLSGAIGLSASTSVETGIRVRVLAWNKSVQASLAASPVSEGGDAIINAGASSWTRTTIDEAYMSIRVIDAEGQIIKTFVTEKRQISPGQPISFLPIIWGTLGVRPGIYTLDGTLHFDGYETATTAKLQIGELTVNIDQYTKAISSGKINEINVLLSSNWNHPLASVHYTLESIKGKKSLKSPTFDIDTFGQASAAVFWDATADQPGDYDVVITAHYEGATNEEKGKIKVLAPGELPQLEQPFSFTMLLLIILILLLLIISNLYWFRRTKEKEKEGEKKQSHETAPPSSPKQDNK